MPTTPIKKMRRKQRRKRKIKILRARLEGTTRPDERYRLIQKIRALSPKAPVPDA